MVTPGLHRKKSSEDRSVSSHFSDPTPKCSVGNVTELIHGAPSGLRKPPEFLSQICLEVPFDRLGRDAAGGVENVVEGSGFGESPGDDPRQALAVSRLPRPVFVQDLKSVDGRVSGCERFVRVVSGRQKAIRNSEEVAEVAGQRMTFERGDYLPMQRRVEPRVTHIDSGSQDRYLIRGLPKPRQLATNLA